MKIQTIYLVNKINSSCDFLKLISAILTTLIFSFTPQSATATDTAWQKSLVMGDSKLSDQSLPQAEKCYRQALRELCNTAHTPADEARCLASFANTLTLENKTNEAITTYKKALAILEKSYGNSSAKILPSLFALGSIYEAAGDHDLAMQYYKKAIAINESHYSPFCPAFENQFLRDQIREQTNKNVANDTYNQNTVSLLKKQPGLQSSKILEDLLPTYKEDILKKEYNSDQELTAIFNGQVANDMSKNISKDTDKDIASDNTAMSSTDLKQPETAKRSRRI